MGAPPDRGGQQSAEGLVGPSSSPLPSNTDQSKAFVGLIKGLHGEIDDIARQFPAFAKFAQQMQDAAKSGMVEVMSKMSQPEPSGAGLVG